MTTETLSKMKEICQIYQEHLQQSHVSDTLGQKKLAIMDELLRCNTPQEITDLLSAPNGPRYQLILQQRRTNYIWTSIEITVILLTFLLAIPLLMLWSWITRGDSRFFKTEGAIVVEKLLKLNEKSKQAIGRKQTNVFIDDGLLNSGFVSSPPHAEAENEADDLLGSRRVGGSRRGGVTFVAATHEGEADGQK